MATATRHTTISDIAEEIFDLTHTFSKTLVKNNIQTPSLASGSTTDLWSSHDSEIELPRDKLVSLTKQLTKLLQGPHGFLHEFISPNWDCGALYTLLEFDILEQISFDQPTHVSMLAQKAELQEGKLLSILRLVACEGILIDHGDGSFSHTAISEELVRDQGFKSFIGFQ